MSIAIVSSRHLLPLLLLVVMRTVRSLELNIHLPLTSATHLEKCPSYLALESNTELSYVSNGEEIDFLNVYTPHVSLFLAHFDLERRSLVDGHVLPGTRDDIRVEHFYSVLQTTLQSKRICRVTINTTNPSSIMVQTPYAMWTVQNTRELRSLSDSIVLALQSFVSPYNASFVPRWVTELSNETVRKEKIDSIKRYGSPNVFSDFSPHITVGYDVDSRDRTIRTRTLEGMVERQEMSHVVSCSGMIRQVGIGLVGHFGGTVLQNPLLLIDLNDDDNFFLPEESSSWVEEEK